MRVACWWSIKAGAVALIAAILIFAPFFPVIAQEIQRGHGINLADMDLSVDPGADFYRYANGGWLDRTTIPADFPSFETISELDGRTRLQLVELLQRRGADGDVVPGSDEWKAIRLFEQGIDLQAREAQGIEPIAPLLRKIDAIADRDDFHVFLESSVFSSMPGLFFVSAGPDLMNSNETVAYLNGPPLGLGVRDYYLGDDPSIAAAQKAYVATTAELLMHSGVDDARARNAAQAVFDFETTLAEPLLTRAETEDFTIAYNPMTPAQLAARYPSLDWERYFSALGLPELETVVVTEPRYFDNLAAIVDATSLPVLKDFLRLQLLWSSSSYLGEDVESTAFAFFGTALTGVQVLAPIEGRTLDQVNHFLGDAVGKLYIGENFTPADKAASEALVDELIDAFRQRLLHNTWMTDTTKTQALAKLDQLTVKVGYPDRWRDYNAVDIAYSYFGSALSAFNAFYRHSLSEIGQPVDRLSWPFPPQTVNALYNPLRNEIIIPAGILQPPFFDAAADPASNFGAIGYVIGHEITHGFDLQGSQFDGQGNLADWWTDQDRARFQALNDRLADQYSLIEVLDDVTVDGQLTLTENVADLGGIQVAYDALQANLSRTGHRAMEGNGAPLTVDQRFFVAAASVWRAQTRDEALMTQLLSDVHAPASVRGTQPLRNCDVFHDTFAIGPGDPMYLPPQERIVIW